MRKTILFFALIFLAVIVRSQEFLTLRLSDTDTAGMVPGDKVYVAVTIEDASPNALIYGFNLTFWHDQSVITWDGTTGNPSSGISYLNPLFPLIAGAWFNVNPNSELVMLWGDGITFADLSGVSFPFTIIEFVFTYHSGSCPLIWGEQTLVPGFELTLINGCVGTCEQNDVTFHVTSDGNDLEGAMATVGNDSIATNSSGLAVFNLPDGDYMYSVTKTGYAEEEGTFTVAGAPLQVDVEMEECWEFGIHLLHNGLPVTDSCLIIINNDSVWTTSGGAVFCVPLGPVSYSVYSENYYPVSGGFIFYGSPTTLNIIMVPISYAITFFINCCGEPVPDYTFSYQAQTVTTNSAGIAVLNLEAGFYSFEIGGVLVTFTVPDTTYMPVDICSEVIFQITNSNCENSFDGLFVICYGDTVQSGGILELENGLYTWELILEGCGSLEIGMVEVNSAPVIVEIIVPWLPQVTFHILSSGGGNLLGVEVIVDTDTLFTNSSGEASFCMTGGYHDYMISKAGFDTFVGTFVFPCEDTTITVLMNPVEVLHNQAESFTIYPNPSSGIFYMRNDLLFRGSVEISVFDITGRMTYFRNEKVDEQIEIDLSDRDKGIYMIHLNTGHNNLIKKLILK